MSTRWSYGPEGLRERPVKNWSDGIALPRWRDVQPLLIRSAGVVGIVAIVMTVVASDGFRLREDGEGRPSAGRPARPEIAPTAAVLASADLRAISEPEPVLTAIPDGEAAPLRIALVEQVTAGPSSADVTPPARSVEEVTSLWPADAPAVVASAESTRPPPAAELAQGIEREAGPASEPPLADLRRETAVSAAAAQGPVATASVLATDAAPPAPAPLEPAPAVAADVPVAPVAAANVPIADLNVPDDAPEPPPATEARRAVAAVSPKAEACLRDWIAAQGGEGDLSSGSGCAAIVAMIPPVAEDARQALEAAAAEHAGMLASLPRIPQARPEPPPGFKPEKPRPQRVAGRSDWPDEPPPNCAAGKRAKWRFVDQAAGKKEWYCR